MKENQMYFVYKNGEKIGPLSVCELKKCNLERTDLVWYSELENWTRAGEIKELQSVFEFVPPEININQYSTSINLSPNISRSVVITEEVIGDIHYLSNNTLKLYLHNEVVYFRFANFGERLAARILDTLIVILPSFIPIVPWLYFSFMQSSDSQQTIGQKTLNIKLLSLDGSKITFGQATGRFFGNILNIVTIFIGYLMMFFSLKKQCLHDRVSDTIVVSELRREKI